MLCHKLCVISGYRHGVSRIIIEANDTDIIVMAIYNKIKINVVKELRIHKVVSSSNSYLPCHRIADSLISTYPTVDITAVLLSAYILFKIGKKRDL